jgi:hydroxymethylpyrimidine pyrophosphatase-like HAD family hydrolase
MTDSPTIYLDLDGTLLGHNASLLHNAAGENTTVAIDALQKIRDAHAEVVVATGRDEYRSSEFSRVIGVNKFIAELGCVIHTTDESVIDYGDAAQKFIDEQSIDSSGFFNCVMDAAHMLVSLFAGRLELHAPYNRDRYASVLLRGNIDVEKANALLSDGGWPFLNVVANGHGMFRRTMPGVENVLIYHLSPVGTSKGSGIARDQQLRGIKHENSFLIGDGLADVLCSEFVNAVYVPTNGLESDPDTKEYVETHDNVHALTKSHNEGFAEAVDIILSKY